MKPPSALIVSHDPVAAALIGASVELAGLEPAFAADGERLRDAIRRLRPAVVLADCDREDGTAEAVVGPALMTGARVALYCSATALHAIDRSRAVAERYDLPFFSLPADTDALVAFLAIAARHGVQGA